MLGQEVPLWRDAQCWPSRVFPVGSRPAFQGTQSNCELNKVYLIIVGILVFLVFDRSVS